MRLRCSLLFRLISISVVSLLLYSVDCNGLSVTDSKKHLLILGYGPVARAVAREIDQDTTTDWEVTATTRQDIKQTSTSQPRLIPYSVDDVKSALDGCTHVLVTIPAPKDADDLRCKVEESIAENLSPTAWVGLVSTTGVYGNHDNAWVTEDAECENPNHPYLLYEESWRKIAGDRTFRIFRCAGLYGPERSALHTVFNNGYTDAPLPENPVLTNRIHEDDVARAIVASMDELSWSSSGPSERIYNLADDEPEARAVVMHYAVELFRSIGASIPEPVDGKQKLESSPRSSRRGVERKRVSNRRVKQELVKKWKHPTYREGLSAILQSTAAPWQKNNCI